MHAHTTQGHVHPIAWLNGNTWWLIAVIYTDATGHPTTWHIHLN